MRDVITKPGKYQIASGWPVSVLFIDGGVAFGRDADEHPRAWRCVDGTIVGDQWGGAKNITGPWHEPPTPPDGFQLMPREYVAECSVDRVWNFGHWEEVRGFAGMTVEEIGRKYDYSGPHYIASPIPKPFRISEHGVGVYETRDGRELKVVSRCGPQSYPWCGEQAIYRRQWSDSGKRFHNRDVEDDLVRYIGPLPAEKPQEPWTPKQDFRAKVAVEQRWTRGTEEEWRPVAATVVPSMEHLTLEDCGFDVSSESPLDL